MAADTPDKAKLRRAYSALRSRLLAERRLEEARMTQIRETLRRIDRELASLERDQRQLELVDR